MIDQKGDVTGRVNLCMATGYLVRTDTRNGHCLKTVPVSGDETQVHRADHTRRTIPQDGKEGTFTVTMKEMADGIRGVVGLL